MNSGKIKKIFIVDDDEMLTSVLEDYLTRKIPHQVSKFSTGEECLRKLYEQPDVIILDYYLNSVSKNAANGMEILQLIKRDYPKGQIIMLSNQEQYGIAVQTIQKGAEQYVMKDENAFAVINSMVNNI